MKWVNIAPISTLRKIVLGGILYTIAAERSPQKWP